MSAAPRRRARPRPARPPAPPRPSRRAAARDGEDVPEQHQHEQGRHAEHQPVRGQREERRRDRSACARWPGRRRRAHARRRRPWKPDRAPSCTGPARAPVRRSPPRAPPPAPIRSPLSAVVSAEPASPAPTRRAHADRGRSAQRGDGGTGRRGDDVGLHQLSTVDDVRQRRREPGQHEAAHPGHRQSGEVERNPGDACDDDRRDAERQHGPQEVGHQQHPAAVPAVQQRPGERPEHGVRHAGAPRARRPPPAGPPPARG